MDSSKQAEAAGAAAEIDYDHISVAEIMARIQKAAAAPPAAAADVAAPRAGSLAAGAAPENGVPAEPAETGIAGAGEPPAEFVESSMPPEVSAAPTSSEPAPPGDWIPEPQGAKAKIKKIIRKLMRPFFPIIRLLGFPIHEELRETIKSLHQTNVRLDNLYRLLDRQAQKTDQGLQRLDVLLGQGLQRLERTFEESLERLAVRSDQNLQRVEVRLDQNVHGLETRLDLAGERSGRAEVRLDLLEPRIKDLDKSMEYIRLLHNLEHNLVVELTKLKVEAETLKSKFRILEKDQEIDQRRERALEEQVLK